MSVKLLQYLSLVSLALAAPAAEIASDTVTLSIPNKPSSNRQCINPNYQAFSIEFAHFHDYTGNSTYKNKLNINLTKNLRQIGGTPLYMRIGGSSQNVAAWNETQEVGLRYDVPSGSDKPSRSWVGPKIVEGFNTWPKDTKYTFGLPFNFTNYANLENTDLNVAPLVVDYLGAQLEALEVGNEFGHGFKKGPQGYVDLWLAYARNISQACWGVLDHPQFWVGAFQEPKCKWSEDSTCYDVEGILKLGIQESGLAKATNSHMYMGSAGESWTANPQFLMNHNNTAGKVDIHSDLAGYATSVGLPYYLGESNSLSGHGRAGVSDAFASALWTIDYILYAAQTNISRVYLHQGNGWKYSAWNPYDLYGVSGGVKGSYYSFLFTATALAGGGKQVELLYSTDTFVAYGIYANGCSTSGEAKLDSIIAVNLQAWSSTSEEDRPSQTITVSGSKNWLKAAKVRRLTAEGADSKTGITFAGQTVDSEGTIRGVLKTEQAPDDRVSVYASEAVLIQLK